jgi:hypothetical protein
MSTQLTRVIEAASSAIRKTALSVPLVLATILALALIAVIANYDLRIEMAGVKVELEQEK